MAIKQTIPSYTNTNKSLTLGNFKGMDVSSSPFEVDISRATYCENLINENGVNHKRPGWKTVLALDKIGDVKALFRITLNGQNHLIVITKNGQATTPFDGTYWFLIKLYRYTKEDFSDMEETTSIYCSSLDFDNCSCFIRKDKAYIKWAGGYVIVEEDKIYTPSSVAYIPATTISINKDSDETATRQTYQSANLLSKRRKNTLVGSSDAKLSVNVISNTESYNGKDFEITLTDSIGNSMTYSCDKSILVKCTTYSFSVKCINENHTYYEQERTGNITISPYSTIQGTQDLTINFSNSSSGTV